MPAPLPKATELAERVAELGLGRAPVVDELALRRIAADAKRIASTDGANAGAVLGRVAALQWNIVELKRQYELAISMNDSATSRRDYAMSLFLVGEAGSAYKMAHDAWRRAPGNPAVIEQLVVAAVHDARFRQAKTFCDRWSKLVPTKTRRSARWSKGWRRPLARTSSVKKALGMCCVKRIQSGAMRAFDRTAWLSCRPSKSPVHSSTNTD